MLHLQNVLAKVPIEVGFASAEELESMLALSLVDNVRMLHGARYAEANACCGR
jgi:hypothetical protein